MCPPPPPPPHMHGRVAYNSRLTPFEYNFHNDMREQERSSRAACCMAPPDIQSGPRGRWPPVPDIIRLRNQYSSGIMSVPVGEPPTTMSTARTTLTLYPVLVAVTENRAVWWLKEERKCPDVARCNELCRPVKLLPSSQHTLLIAVLVPSWKITLR